MHGVILSGGKKVIFETTNIKLSHICVYTSAKIELEERWARVYTRHPRKVRSATRAGKRGRQMREKIRLGRK